VTTGIFVNARAPPASIRAGPPAPKDCVGTGYNSSSLLWFTLSHGIVNEVYYPRVDRPNTRDLQFLITDGKTFLPRGEARSWRMPSNTREHGVPLCRLTNTDPPGALQIVKEVIGDPHTSVLLMHTRLEILHRNGAASCLYALLAPHLDGSGKSNSAQWSDTAGPETGAGRA